MIPERDDPGPPEHGGPGPGAVRSALARHFAAVVQASQDAIYGTTLDGRVISWNPAAEQLFGWTAEAIVGQPEMLLLPPDGLVEAQGLLQSLRAGEPVAACDGVRLHRDGTRLPVQVRLSPVVDDDGRLIAASAIVRSLKERQRSERMLWLQRSFDTLTGLATRAHFLEQAHEAMRAAGGHDAALLVLELRGLDRVVGALGRNAADQIVAQAARRLRQVTRAGEFVGRLADAQLAVLTMRGRSRDGLHSWARRTADQLEAPYPDGEQSLSVQVAVGIALAQDGAQDAEALAQHAQLALAGTAPDEPRQHVAFSDADRFSAARHDLALQDALRQAVERRELTLLYQPIVRLRDRTIGKAEALMRWESPRFGAVAPDDFIRLAERTGLIGPVGDWLFGSVLDDARRLADARPGVPLQLSFNVSGAQFALEPHLAFRWLSAISLLDLPPGALVVEATERLMIDAQSEAATGLAALARAGVQIALDDFGTGHSSLGQLTRLPIHYLKIDKSFVCELGLDPRADAVCRAVVSLAQALGLQTVAEGVETPGQHERLLAMGCDWGQGWLYGRPMPLSALESRRGAA